MGKRLLFIILKGCLLLLFLFPLSQVVLAENDSPKPSLEIETGEVQRGDTIRVNIFNLPLSNPPNIFYSLNIKGEGAPTNTAAIIKFQPNGKYEDESIKYSCIFDSNEIWSNIRSTCGSTNQKNVFTFQGFIDTSKLYDGAVDTSFSISILGGGYEDKPIDEKKFVIRTTKDDNASFSIENITPDPVKKGEVVIIKLNGAKKGTYNFGIQGGQLSSGNCSDSLCRLGPLTIPSDASGFLEIIVIGPDGDRQTKIINITDIDRGCYSTEVDQLPLCNEYSKFPADTLKSCKAEDGKGYYCAHPNLEVLCVETEETEEGTKNPKEPKEDNLACEIPPPLPPPCGKFVTIIENPVTKEKEEKNVTEEVETAIKTGKFNPKDPNYANFKCAIVETAVLPINTSPEKFVGSIMGLILGLSGGIAVLLIIVSGYKFMSSQGNPEKVQGAKESLTSAIVGLLFIIFALVILEVIGVDILHLFSKS